MYQACSVVCKVEDFKPASNNFRSEFIGKDQAGRKQYRGISFKKTQFGDIEDINYYPLMKEFIEIAGKAELLKTVKDYCREHCAWLKTENDMTKKWRRIFMMMGAKFEWYCVEVKHFNCFNELSNDETFICWDSAKQDVWVRQPPSFAIRNHKLLRPRIDAYQDFLPRTTVSGITMVGIRTAESVQRLQNIASMTKAGNKMTAKKQVFPIYDWTDNDVWLFLLRNHVDIPEIYLFLWQSGSSKRQMRVSQFFSVDTARSLVKMNEYYPDLMERIIRREPNAYLAALYWDSEMFGRSSRKRKEAEEGQEQRDYRQELIHLFNHMDVFFDTPHKRHVAERYRNFFMAVSAIATSADCKHIYEGLISGDPKMRAFRALYQRVYGRYINDAKKGEHHGQ